MVLVSGDSHSNIYTIIIRPYWTKVSFSGGKISGHTDSSGEANSKTIVDDESKKKVAKIQLSQAKGIVICILLLNHEIAWFGKLF